MKHIKIAAGLAHINYGKLTQLVKEAEAAGVDYIHSDAADMHDLQNMKLMGGWQIIQAIRPEVKIPVECHIYTISMDKMFIEQIHSAGANMLIIPAEHFIGAQLTYIINWCRERKIKVGLT
ncbi:MAG: pentose-5-phosphate 3-epimerase, partial [Solobacterium sp.]|nr:pentose-5-phosphate 3-epimerase [Solobacterium sp.]